ncbi:unnamed protein product [Orchesella dallaii]|uniref:Uncharacterized protein n=1 Tax=Orchesella dallaii TaxID=48710 RepID=A0ABP1PSF5_9HEXA
MAVRFWIYMSLTDSSLANSHWPSPRISRQVPAPALPVPAPSLTVPAPSSTVPAPSSTIPIGPTNSTAPPGATNPVLSNPSNITSNATTTYVNNPIRAWSSPNSTSSSSSTHNGLSMYSAEMLEKLVQNYHGHTTTNDPLNERYYTYRRLGDNVWFNIERVAPYKTYMNWMISTNRITDRLELGKSVLSRYIAKAGEPCAPETAFEVPDDVIMTDNKNVRVDLDPVITQWFETNENTPPEKMCNRFIGLTCSSGTCTCGSDDSVGFKIYDRTSVDKPGEYQDGCYVKPWKQCRHMSYDANIPAEYKAFHAHRNNMKQLLMRMATPLPSTPRCEKGTYCVDMILNKHRPICWCASRMNKDCLHINGSLPLLTQFLEIRKKFHRMLILERDREAECTIDPEMDEYLEGIHRFSDDPEQNYFSVLKLMKQVLRKGVRFCDFRKGEIRFVFKMETCMLNY